MWKLSRGENFLAGVSLRALHTKYDKEKSEKSKLRLLAAIHRKKGRSLDEITDILSKPRRTVHGWLVRLHKRGLGGLRDVKQSGRPAQLSRRQLRTLERHLERGPPHNLYGLWTTKLVRKHVYETYGIEFTPRHLRRVLQELGFSVQKPRPRHYKANPAAQAAFKKKLDGSSENTDGKDTLSPVWTKAHSASRRSYGVAGRSAAASR